MVDVDMKEMSADILEKLGDQKKLEDIITSENFTHYNSATGGYNIGNLSLKPNTIYLVIGYHGTDNGALITLHMNINCSNATRIWAGANKQYAQAGQGGTCFAVIKTGDSVGSAYGESYAYATGYTEYFHMVGIPLVYTGGVLARIFSTKSPLRKEAIAW